MCILNEFSYIMYAGASCLLVFYFFPDHYRYNLGFDMRISRVLSTWSIWKMAACRAIELSIPSTLAEVQMRKVSLLASCFGFVPWGRVVLASLPACRWSQRHSRTPTTRLKSHFSMQTRLRMTSWYVYVESKWICDPLMCVVMNTMNTH